MEQDSLKKAKGYALRLLARRSYSVREMRERFSRHAVPSDVCEQLIEDLVQKKLLDDEAFARAFAQERLSLHPTGWRVMKAKLAQKGIARDLIERVVEELKPSYDEEAVALELARRRLSRLKGLSPVESKRRLFGFLSRRGFSLEAVQRAIGKISDDVEER